MRLKIVEIVNYRLFYGWIILLIAGVGVFASGPGQSHTFSVFIGHISRDLGLSATAISFAYGLATLVAALGLPMVGRLVDSHGARRIMSLVVILLGGSCIAFGFAPGIVWLALGFGALRFFGQGSLMLNCTNVITHWFGRKRGFAIGLMLMGFVVSMAIHPPICQWLIEQVGWRETWFWLGVSTWGLMLPLIFLFLHNAPENVNLYPDGVNNDTKGVKLGIDRYSAEFGFTLNEALRTSTFYIVATGLCTLSMLVTSLHFFQVPIFEHQGLSSAIAAWMFPLSALIAIVTQPFVGRILDSFPTPRVFAIALMTLFGSLVSMAFVHDLVTAVVYAVIFGVNNAFNITLFGYVWPRYFGRRYIGSIQGMGQMIGVVGASVGPLPLGIAFDLFGDYQFMLLSLAALPVIAVILTQFLKEPQMKVC
ncbi:MAG: MFS transporter [Rhodospirillaceae bacterium]|nr:MFS transporter [Rhodospirillaceae bacterium]